MISELGRGGQDWSHHFQLRDKILISPTCLQVLPSFHLEQLQCCPAPSSRGMVSPESSLLNYQPIPDYAPSTTEPSKFGIRSPLLSFPGSTPAHSYCPHLQLMELAWLLWAGTLSLLLVGDFASFLLELVPEGQASQPYVSYLFAFRLSINPLMACCEVLCHARTLGHSWCKSFPFIHT